MCLVRCPCELPPTNQAGRGYSDAPLSPRHYLHRSLSHRPRDLPTSPHNAQTGTPRMMAPDPRRGTTDAHEGRRPNQTKRYGQLIDEQQNSHDDEHD